MSFKGILVEQQIVAGEVTAHSANLQSLDDELLGDPTGESALIDVEYSGLNYKDAMALTGRRGILHKSPVIPGIDLVGIVIECDNNTFQPGDRVLLNGAGIGERFNGGMATRARVSTASLLAVPDAFSAEQAAQLGTAGFTAMLCVLALEDSGLTPADGEVLVTGASGGVGSCAVALLAAAGFKVVASTGRLKETNYLMGLGAERAQDRTLLSEPGKPLQSQLWAGAIDTVGSHTLANVLAQTSWGGTVACCGLAQGRDLPTTVVPFILRAITLTGANSVDAPLQLRQRAWTELSERLDAAVISELGETIPLAATIDQAERVLAGDVRGHLAVDVRS